MQEQIKTDMETMKEPMATMMEAMMSMKKIMEVNAAAIATVSVVSGVDPTPPSGLKLINHPTAVRAIPILCKSRTNRFSRHMVCLRTILHPMRMSITPLLYSLRANNLNLIMHMSLDPWRRHMKFPTTI